MSLIHMLTHCWAVGGLRCGSTCGHKQWYYSWYMLPKVTHTPQKFMQTQSQRVCITIVTKMTNGEQSDVLALWCLTLTVYFI